MTNPIKNAIIGSVFELKDMAMRLLKRDRTGNENSESNIN
jgi:hypothetical protein